MFRLLSVQKDQVVQAMPLIKDKVNLTEGFHGSVSLVRCVLDGNIRITWNDDTTDDITCAEGDDYALPGEKAKGITILSGKFHIA